MSESNSDDDIFTFESLTDPFKDIDTIPDEKKQPEKASVATKQVYKILAEHYPDSALLLKGQKKKKKRDKRQTQERREAVIEPVIDDEKWAHLESFFENEEDLTIFPAQMGSSVEGNAEQGLAQGGSISQYQGEETANGRDLREVTAEESVQGETTLRSHASEEHSAEAISGTISGTHHEKRGEAHDINTEENGERGIAPEEHMVKTDPRLATCKNGSVMAPRVFNVMMETADVQCEQCGHHFGSQLALKRHKTAVHRAEGKFQCSFCPEKLASEINRKKHERTQHDCSGGVRLECEFEGCNAFFNKKLNLSMHRKKFHGVRFKSTKAHSGETSREVFVCAFCEYSTKNRSNLDRHVFSKHGAGWETKGGHRFGCAQCGRRFVHRTNYRLHKCGNKGHKRRKL